MPEITNAEAAEYARLQVENKTLKETAENTKKGFDANRTEISELKDKVTGLETTVTEKDTELNTKTEELATKETELTESKELGQKWTDHETANAEAITTNIEKLKTDLGDKLTDAHKEFIDGLDDSKVESYLKGISPEEKKAPSTDDGKGGGNPGGADPSAFDSAAADKNLGGMMNALNDSMSLE